MDTQYQEAATPAQKTYRLTDTCTYAEFVKRSQIILDKVGKIVDDPWFSAWAQHGDLVGYSELCMVMAGCPCPDTPELDEIGKRAQDIVNRIHADPGYCTRNAGRELVTRSTTTLSRVGMFTDYAPHEEALIQVRSRLAQARALPAYLPRREGKNEPENSLLEQYAAEQCLVIHWLEAGAGVANPLGDRVVTELACPTVTYTKALYGAVQKACISWLGYMVLLEDVTLLQRRNAALSIVKEKLWYNML